MTEWNEWRKKHPEEDVELDGQNFSSLYLVRIHFNSQQAHDRGSRVYLRNTTLYNADLREAVLHHAYLEGAKFNMAKLQGSDFHDAHVQGTIFYQSHIEGASFRTVVVNAETSFWQACVDRETKFEGTSLNTFRIDPATKQLLEYNIRQKNWEKWYKYKDWQSECKNKRHVIIRVLMWFIKLFWSLSDYGRSTLRIIGWFFGLAFLFAIIYYAWGFIDYYHLSNKDYPGIVSNLFVLEDSKQAVSGWLVPLRSVYFSIITMTTLGFGDMYANAHSLFRGIFGHILLALQVTLGYVLLGALVTRFAVLFTAGGPAGKFADE